MDIRKVKKLIELLEESGIAEIEIKEGEESVRISRMPTGAPMPRVRAPRRRPPCGHRRPRRSRPRRPPNLRPRPPHGRHTCRRRWSAPSTPRPRRAPSPSSRSATRSRSGQVLCIIEAMKMMNQIESDHAGTRHGDPGQERRAGRIRPAAVRDRVSKRQPHARQGRHRQPRRNRAAHPARLPRARHQDGRGALDGRHRTSSTCCSPTRSVCIGPPPSPLTATSTCRRSSAPPRSPTRSRSIRATASCPRTPTSPSASRRAASSSSAPRPRPSG